MTWSSITIEVVRIAVGPLVVGLVLFWLGSREATRRLRSDAIRDLMAYRGDLVSQDFRRTLNKISVVFHNKSDIRDDIRKLWEALNDTRSEQGLVKRKIVSLIYKLCKGYGFSGLTEYDIDQAFPEYKQTPDEPTSSPASLSTTTPTTPSSPSNVEPSLKI